MPVEAGSLKVVERVLKKLKPYKRNARKHPPAQIEALRESVRRRGIYRPILLREDMTIGVGHGLCEAAIAEGIEKGPTIVLKGLSEAEWKELVLADNRLAEMSSWDTEIMKLELGDLSALGIDMGPLGFSLDDLAGLGTESKKPKADPNAVPPVPVVPISGRGDLWTLGDHQLLCGDSTSAEDVAAVMGKNVAELCLSDPPYGIGFGYKDHDDRNNDQNAELVGAVFALAPTAKVWSPGTNNLARDISRFGRSKTLYWHKGFAAAGNGLGGASTVEPFLVVGPPKRRKLANDYLDFKTDREELEGKSLKEHHPCPKPVSLFQHLAEAFCEEGERIYEPFSGSGTTLVACELSGRKCHAIEIDPAYVDVAIMRWQGVTGREAVLSDGRTFAEVKAERLAEAA